MLNDEERDEILLLTLYLAKEAYFEARILHHDPDENEKYVRATEICEKHIPTPEKPKSCCALWEYGDEFPDYALHPIIRKNTLHGSECPTRKG